MPKSTTFKNFIRGVIPTSGVMSQPKGSVPRISNMLLTKRGSFRTCDGSQLIHAFGGAVQNNRGKITCSFLFNPIGVSNYYLAIAKALDIPLGPPQNLTASLLAGGSLTVGTNYYYVVTAVDGAGGETTVSNEVHAQPTTGNQTIQLTWNVVPNAVSYNVYRGGSTGTELLYSSAGVPVPQSPFGTITATFSDTNQGNQSFLFGVVSVDNTKSPAIVVLGSLPAPQQVVGLTLTYAGGTPSSLSGQWQFLSYIGTSSGLYYFQAQPVGFTPPAVAATGGTMALPSPPTSDTTQQTALFRMPFIIGNPASLPVSYSDLNIVALFPADLNIPAQGTGGGGGSGGGGGTGGGGSGGKGGTVSGGVYGNVSFTPQMVEFTNQVVIALGNGFPPQVYSDPATTDNPATTSTISSISVDAFGVVTITAPHGISTNVLNAGANVIVSGFGGLNTVYNGTFPVIEVVSSSVIKVRNLAAIGASSSSGGTLLTTTIPLYSNFVPAFPNWSATTVYAVNSVVQPSPANGHYYKAVQGGTSGGSQPSFPTGTGQRVTDGSIIWQEAGLVNSAAPAPPGGAHIGVYSGALFVLDTSPFNISTGLDGPCSLRMSDVDNLNSWNPINQAFLDKDDGTEGAGLSSFTITAQGIAPQGSLVAFKNYSTYQILGLFGAPDFTIQRVKTDMGSTAPRTIQYVPGFGIMRMTHLGFGIFDGVDDRVVSEEIRPYLFPSNDPDLADITVMDSNWVAVAWAAQTATPPLYASAIPIGNSGGQLTRIVCYDLVLKAWTIVDLPFAISTMSQFRTVTANPVTVMGGFNDGVLSRWQAGDETWDTGATGRRTPSNVIWSLKSPTLSANDLDDRMYIRRCMVRGISDVINGTGLTVSSLLYLDGKTQLTRTYPVPPTGDFELEVGAGFTVLRAEVQVGGSQNVEIFGFSWGVVAKPSGVPASLAYG